MIHIYNDATDEFIGSISEEDFRFLQSDLEEESLEDVNYYINQATVDMFEQQGASPALVAVLRAALGDEEDVDIRWERG